MEYIKIILAMIVGFIMFGVALWFGAEYLIIKSIEQIFLNVNNMFVQWVTKKTI